MAHFQAENLLNVQKNAFSESSSGSQWVKECQGMFWYFNCRSHDLMFKIKENGNNVRMKHFIYNLACICTLFKLRNNGMFSETVKQVRKRYKITSCQMFLCLGPGLGRGRRHYAIVLRVNNRN